MKPTMRLALAGVLALSAIDCSNFNDLTLSDGKPGSFCFQNSDCLSKYCVLEAYTDPPHGACSR